MNNKFSSKIKQILEEGERCKEQLCFSGPTGPTGPSGSSIDSYGSKYNTAGSTLSLTENIVSTIPLATTGPILGIDGTDENTLTVNESGIYKIDYFFNGSPSVQATMTLEVLQNGNLIGRTSIEKEASANEDEMLYGSAIVNLSEGDKLTLGITSNVAATISLATSTSAYLNVIKLS